MPEPTNFQDLSQFQVPGEFRGKPAWFVQLWWLVQAIFFHPSPQAFFAWRRFLLRVFGAQIGRHVLIRSSASFTYPWKVKVGDYSWIGDDVVLYSLSQIQIGSHSVISQRSYLSAATHDPTRVTFDMVSGPIHIADQVWIAADVFVAPGVSIGKGCLVGARSSVFHDLPAGMICYGNPARAVRARLPAKEG